MKILRMNNKGYAMTEALIVSTVVLTALVLIYLQFTKLNSAYGEQYYYNNVNGVYALNQISSYISDEDNSNLVTDLTTYVDITSCNSRYFDNENYCKMLMSATNVEYIIFTHNNKKTLLAALKASNPYDMRLQSFIKSINISNDNEYMLVAKFKEGYYAAIPYIPNAIPSEITAGTNWDFGYNGIEETDPSVQVFVAPQSGLYQLEVWGAQGGAISSTSTEVAGGYGGYSKGTMYLAENETIYVTVGGQGEGSNTTGSATGGYNGGGSAATYISSEEVASGGGATHIAKETGVLSALSSNLDDILIVAGGGGGSFSRSSKTSIGGSGGGFTGANASTCTTGGATQIAGGAKCGNGGNYAGTFGAGGNGQSWSGAAGGGYYGGGGGYGNAGGGGSGYLSNYITEKAMYCYDCTEELSDENTYTISTTTGTLKDAVNCPNGYSENAVSNCAKAGAGAAKITYLGGMPINTTWNFDYNGTDGTDGSVQTFKAIAPGTYKLEVWGASGGDYDAADKNGYHQENSGGRGGYSTADITLTSGSILYITIGGEGKSLTANSSDYHQTGVAGGYNGGGNGGDGASWGFPGGTGGGGATHIATSLIDDGQLKKYVDNKDAIVIVAGGGGGAGWETVGGYGGGLSGGTVTASHTSTGGTQSTGYSFGQGSPGYTGHDTPGSSEGSGGSGGGYYGGSTFVADGSQHASVGGGGGSGYVGTLQDAQTIAGNESMPTHDGTSTMTGNTGNGYAKITYIAE